jgi:uncharacterized integral membrane protein
MAIKLRTVILVLVFFAVLLFAAVNWALFMQPTPINVLFATVMAPLGLIMLAILGGVTLLFSILLAKTETEHLLGSRHAHREVDEARKLALSAEESRLTALREEMGTTLASLDEKVSEILRRVDAQGRVVVRQESTVPAERVVRADEPAL